jgi:hypothetical protein
VLLWLALSLTGSPIGITRPEYFNPGGAPMAASERTRETSIAALSSTPAISTTAARERAYWERVQFYSDGPLEIELRAESCETR